MTLGSLGTQLLKFIISPAAAATYNTPQQDAFFTALDSPLTQLAGQLGAPSSYLLGLSAFENGYLDPHNTALNNPFGLTQAGGNNISFTSLSSAISYFNSLYGNQIAGATSPQDFAQRLEGVLNGAPVPGWHTYNTVNANWENSLVSIINSIPTRETNWINGH